MVIKKRDLSPEEIIRNPYRKKILELCAKSKSASQLKKELKIGPATLYHHLNILEENKLIDKEYATDNGGNKKRGRETTIKTNQTKLNEFINNISKMWETNFMRMAGEKHQLLIDKKNSSWKDEYLDDLIAENEKLTFENSKLKYKIKKLTEQND